MSDNTADDEKPRIIVDSDWKQQAEREKEELAGKAATSHESTDGPLPAPDFLQHLASLATHAMILLGAVPNPMTGASEYDPAYARHMIDTIAMLRDKAKGNLSAEEEKTIESLLGELRFAWVSVTSRPPESGTAEGAKGKA